MVHHGSIGTMFGRRFVVITSGIINMEQQNSARRWDTRLVLFHVEDLMVLAHLDLENAMNRILGQAAPEDAMIIRLVAHAVMVVALAQLGKV